MIEPTFLSSIKAPTIVGFEVTPSCNRRCEYCEPSKVSPNGYFTQNPLSTDEIKKIIDKISEAEIHYIFLTGGELTLRKDLPEIVKRCYEKEIFPNLLTNAEVVDKELVKRLFDLGMENVQISVEGTEKFHDNVTQSPNSFKKVKRGIEIFFRGGFNVYVTSIALRKTLPSLPDLVRQLPEIGVYGYGTVKLRVHKKEDLNMVPPKRLLIKCNQEIREACKDSGVELLKLYEGLGISKHTIPDTHYPSSYVCNMGKIKMEILSDGSVVPCKSLKRPYFVVGNLLKDDIQHVWNHPTMKMFRYMTPDDYKGTCGVCDYRQSCHCCRAVAYNLTGDIFGEDLTCYKLAEENNRKELL